MSGFQLVAYLYRCQYCGIEQRVVAGEPTFLICNHPLLQPIHVGVAEGSGDGADE